MVIAIESYILIVEFIALGTHKWLSGQLKGLEDQLVGKSQLCTFRRLAEIQKVMNEYHAIEHEIQFSTKVNLKSFCIPVI